MSITFTQIILHWLWSTAIPNLYRQNSLNSEMPPLSSRTAISGGSRNPFRGGGLNPSPPLLRIASDWVFTMGTRRGLSPSSPLYPLLNLMLSGAGGGGKITDQMFYWKPLRWTLGSINQPNAACTPLASLATVCSCHEGGALRRTMWPRRTFSWPWQQAKNAMSRSGDLVLNLNVLR